LLAHYEAETTEIERTKCFNTKPNIQPTKANPSEKNIETEADYLSATAGG